MCVEVHAYWMAGTGREQKEQEITLNFVQVLGKKSHMIHKDQL